MLEKVLVGLSIPLVVALIVYIFKIRQLYLLVPKMFGHENALSSKGKIVEIRVWNRGKAMEEDVHVEMPPQLSYTLLASDQAGMKLDSNRLTLARLSPLSEASAVLLAEGEFTAEGFAPSLTSKAAKGTVLKRIEDLPGNFGHIAVSVALVFGLMIGIFSLGTGAIKAWEDFQARRWTAQTKDGWKLGNFAASNFSESYNGSDFPVAIKSITRKGDKISVTFTLANKATNDVEFSAYLTLGDKDKDRLLSSTTAAFNRSVAPFQAKDFELSAELPRGFLDAQNLRISFSFEVAGEFTYMYFYISESARGTMALKGP